MDYGSFLSGGALDDLPIGVNFFILGSVNIVLKALAMSSFSLLFVTGGLNYVEIV